MPRVCSRVKLVNSRVSPEDSVSLPTAEFVSMLRELRKRGREIKTLSQTVAQMKRTENNAVLALADMADDMHRFNSRMSGGDGNLNLPSYDTESDSETEKTEPINADLVVDLHEDPDHDSDGST